MGQPTTYTAPCETIKLASGPIYALSWSSNNVPSSSSSKRRVYGGGNATRDDDGALIPRGSRLAIGSIIEEFSNEIQVLGHIGDRDVAGQPQLSVLATAPHLYPATKVAFQPSSLSTASSSTSSLNTSERSYMSPASKLAKRGSWGTGCQGAAAGSPPSSSLLLPNDESHDGYPNRELLASTADCLRIWECARNADVGAAGGRNFDGVTGTLEDEESSVGTGSGASGYAGWRGKDASTNIRTRFNLWEKSVLAHSKSSMSPPAPLTSFSWNQPSPNLIVTSSIDTTCTIWDLPTRTALTQLIAHDREVYDVDWCPGSSDVFASVGADGSVRVFDLRSLEHSTIIYETAGPPPSSSRPGTGMSTSSSSRNGSTAGVLSGPAAPLLRIAFNPWDANYLATFHMESDSIQILDVRAPGLPILELKGHKSGINAVAWGPPSQTGASLNTISGAGSGSSSSSISKGMLCTAADDAHVLVYDLASSTLRSASAQGRRSRTSNAAAAAAAAGAGAAGVGGAAPSPAPSHHRHQSLSHSLSSASLSSAGWGSATPVEYPFMAYEAKEMVNNVAWFRPASHRDGAGASMEIGRVHGRSPSTSMLEWNEYTATARGGGAGSSGPVRQDWLACVAGRDLRALRVG